MATTLVAASVLSACGGGGTTADEAGVPVASTSQEMGSAGGTLSLQELSLTLPASALTESVQVSLQRETVASPALARFRLGPAGHALSVPAELRYSATGLAANVRFFWEVNGEQWLIPGNISAGVLTSFITSLGYTAAGTVMQAQDVEQPASLTERAQAAVARVLPLAESASEGGSLVVQPVDCDAHITVLKTRMARAATDGDQNRAVAVFNELQATREVCAGIRAEELAQASCDALAVAQSNAQVLVASSLGAFSELTVPLYAADAFVQNTGATCSNADPAANQALIDAKFDQLLDVMKGQMARAEFDDALTVRDLRVVMHMDEMCQKVDLGAGCDRLRTELYPDLLDALRSSAFEECRSGGNPQSVSQFYALGSQARVEDKFFGHARFPLAAVEADLNYCSNPALGLRVFDGEDVPGELTDRATTLRPLVALGNYAKQTSIEVPRDGSLNIAGTVGVLRCPDGSASSADLVFRVNGQEWVRRAASGDGYPLESAPLLLDLPTVLPGFGIDPSTSTGFTVTVNREGGGCSDGKQAVLDAPFTLFEVQVNLPVVAGAVKSREIYLSASPYDDDRNLPDVSLRSDVLGAGSFIEVASSGGGSASSTVDTVTANGGRLAGKLECGGGDSAGYSSRVILAVDAPRTLTVQAHLQAFGPPESLRVGGVYFRLIGPSGDILKISVRPADGLYFPEQTLPETTVELAAGGASYVLELVMDTAGYCEAGSVSAVGSFQFSVAP